MKKDTHSASSFHQRTSRRKYLVKRSGYSLSAKSYLFVWGMSASCRATSNKRLDHGGLASALCIMPGRVIGRRNELAEWRRLAGAAISSRTILTMADESRPQAALRSWAAFWSDLFSEKRAEYLEAFLLRRETRARKLS
jgi:hypothetical protein